MVNLYGCLKMIYIENMDTCISKNFLINFDYQLHRDFIWKLFNYKNVLIIQAFGAVPSPFDSFLVNRGLKTLHVRMKEHMKNGLAVAKFLETHPCVEKVIHPGMCP